MGLRPHTVYGPGRDQGLTSAPTAAMLHAAAGRPYTLPFGGAYQLQYAPDVAAAFVAAARSEGAAGAAIEDVGGPTVRVEEVIAAIEAAAPGARIDFERRRAPVPLGDRAPGDADPARGRRGRHGRALPLPARARASSAL